MVIFLLKEASYNRFFRDITAEKRQYNLRGGGTLILHAVIGNGDIDKVISSFGKDINHVQMAFTPKDTSGFIKREVTEDDTHFFVKGKFFEENKEAAFMFQPITHA